MGMRQARDAGVPAPWPTTKRSSLSDDRQ